jgi:glyoxylase-like metal-dependent hydrolase (beta-lactamase superfamily II)
VRDDHQGQGYGAAVTAKICDEQEWGFGWIDPDDALRRCSHALADGGRVWLIDPVEAPVEERIRALGDVVGVIQLLDRHDRDCEAFAQRFDAPYLRVPDAVPDSPFEIVRVVDLPRYRERALWWPERRVLVCADALGTVGYFLIDDERLGLHPFLRLRPPRRLARLDAAHVLVGHGEGVHANAERALAHAFAAPRRRVVRAAARRIGLRR